MKINQFIDSLVYASHLLAGSFYVYIIFLLNYMQLSV